VCGVEVFDAEFFGGGADCVVDGVGYAVGDAVGDRVEEV